MIYKTENKEIFVYVLTCQAAEFKACKSSCDFKCQIQIIILLKSLWDESNIIVSPYTMRNDIFTPAVFVVDDTVHDS